MSDPHDEDEWRFGLDEVDEDGIATPEPEPMEPGSPAPENIAFVLVGAALAVAIGYVTLVGLP